MDFQKYGISPEAQARIDGEFLQCTVDLLNGAAYTLGAPIRDELEAVYLRTHNSMHEAVVDERDIPNQTFINLGKLSFIDTFGFASTRRAQHEEETDTRWRRQGRREYLFYGLFRRLLPEVAEG